jgi:DNA-directed RNA polymerase subunit D
MKIDVLNKTDSEIQFLVEDIKPSFASALRRIMMSEIPTMAIEWVDFKNNDSALNDEIIANRLGQVPLTFDQKAYNLNEECKCEGKGCSRCQVKLILKKKGPSMVYSGDLKSTAKDVKPVYDKIPIVELFANQEIQFEATAQLGFGKVHTKWQGAVVGYKNKAVGDVARRDETDETKYKENMFIFNVESVCGLSAEDVVINAVNTLENKLKEFNKNLSKLK